MTRTQASVVDLRRVQMRRPVLALKPDEIGERSSFGYSKVLAEGFLSVESISLATSAAS